MTLPGQPMQPDPLVPEPDESGSGHRWRRFKALWIERLWRLASPEFILATLILTIWVVMGTLGSLILLVIVLGFGLWIHVGTAENGSHLLVWMATGYVFLWMLLASQFTFIGAGAMSLGVGSMTTLIYNELLRLHLTRRRQAVIDEDVYVGSAVGLGLVGVVSVIGIALASAFDGDGDRSWLWMAAALAVVFIGAVLMTAVPRRRVPGGASGRWRPGDRIPPQPLGQYEPD
ncbi:MAG: hypothetical protein AAF962_06495 [Actinomycetota bacterium]